MSILEEKVEPGCRSTFAKILGLDRSSIYKEYTKLAERNEADAEKLRQAHIENPRYGVRKLAILLHWSEGKTRRIRRLAGIVAMHSKKCKNTSGKSEIVVPPNLLKVYWQAKDPSHPEKGYTFVGLADPSLKIWVQDFTYIWWHGKFYYFAATMSLATRQVVGWSFGCYHTADLICDSLLDALQKNDKPSIVHNDRGSEYMSLKHQQICNASAIEMSASSPGSPWQNGFMESFFSTFKREMRDSFSTISSLPQLYEQIALWVFYYNHERIHTALKMSPDNYAKRLFALGGKVV